MWSERDRGRERERRDGERVCERERESVGEREVKNLDNGVCEHAMVQTHCDLHVQCSTVTMQDTVTCM